MSQREAEVTAKKKTEVNTCDKSVLMDEFTFAMRTGGRAYMPH